VHKTAFAMIYGTFVSSVMQWGDCNAPSMFQQAMNSIFHEYIRIFLHVYLDNLFVYSNLVQEHQKHLELVFKKLREHEIYLREEKCKGNLMIEHNTQILARGIQRGNSKDSPSEGGLHKEQSA